MKQQLIFGAISSTVFVILGQLACLYLNFLAFGAITYTTGLAWLAFWVLLGSIGSGVTLTVYAANKGWLNET